MTVAESWKSRPGPGRLAYRAVLVMGSNNGAQLLRAVCVLDMPGAGRTDAGSATVEWAREWATLPRLIVTTRKLAYSAGRKL